MVQRAEDGWCKMKGLKPYLHSWEEKDAEGMSKKGKQKANR